jgi:hypothetical protein
MIIPKQEFMFESNGTQQTNYVEFDMGQQVTSATAVLEGMDVQFENQDDHNLGRLQVFLTTDVIGPGSSIVRVTAFFALRDWSGGDNDFNGDDPIKGTIHYSVLIDV